MATSKTTVEKHQFNEKKSQPTFSRWLLRVAVQCSLLLATMILGLVVVGWAQRTGWISSASKNESSTAHANNAAPSEYTCPMHPEIRQDQPGDCPICGMSLVPTAKPSNTNTQAAAKQPDGQYICPMMCTPPQDEPGKCPVCAMDLVLAAGSGGDSRSVSIDAASRRILGIRTAKATKQDLHRTLRTVGQIAFDEQRVATIAAYVDGRLEDLYAEYVGVEVAAGDALVVLYSPNLYSAQVEYLTTLQSAALDSLNTGNRRLSDLARENLVELGMTDLQIDSLRNSRQAEKRLRIASPIGGTVIEKLKLEGDYVKQGEPIYRVVDLSMVWLKLELFPSDAAAVRFGQQVEAELQSLPGEVYTGRVGFIDPLVDEKTRTVSVRVEMTNFDGRLKPGDFATATIRVPATAREEVYDPALAGKWISPMHPQIIRTEAGECPICGMDLKPTRDLGFVDAPIPNLEVLTIPRSAVLVAGENSVVYVEKRTGSF